MGYPYDLSSINNSRPSFEINLLLAQPTISSNQGPKGPCSGGHQSSLMSHWPFPGLVHPERVGMHGQYTYNSSPLGPLLLIPIETNDLATFELLQNFHGKIRNQFYFF